MQQLDIFDETLQKKIIRMERWIGRLQKEVWFLKEVYNMAQRNQIASVGKLVEHQSDLFAG